MSCAECKHLKNLLMEDRHSVTLPCSPGNIHILTVHFQHQSLPICQKKIIYYLAI